MPSSVLEILKWMKSMRCSSYSRLYSNADTVKGVAKGEDHYPVEYLNSISGLPSSQLRIKFGMPFMLLWNLDVGYGL